MSWGKNIRLSVFGESHGEAVGVVLEGIRPGLKIDMDEIAKQMKRRAPGKEFTTARNEADAVRVLSGIYGGYTEGTPIAAVIENTDQRSSDYGAFANTPRPSHADYAAFVKYGGYADMRGGGHFSGRLTAPLVFAGAVAMQALARQGIVVSARLYMAGGIFDGQMEHTAETARILNLKDFPALFNNSAVRMKEAMEQARQAGDSIGGIAEAFAVGVKKGLGGPLFESAEGVISSLMFAIPGVKGVEFGSEFAASAMKGSEANDPFAIGQDGEVSLKTNNSGGIQGGITVGSPIVVRVAFKPTASIALEQDTVDLKEKKPAKIQVGGRHDPCIALRGVFAAQSCLAIALLDLLSEA
jgi:chorismate synthase